ncbi:MAG: Flp pilus assembly protein CpaB [Pseudonocardiaceae bacterium]
MLANHALTNHALTNAGFSGDRVSPSRGCSGRVSLARILRSPAAYWLGAVILAAGTGLTASRIVGSARLSASLYGPLRTMVVATGSLPVGSVVSADNLTEKRVPSSALPPGSLASLDAVIGQTVVVPLLAGVPVVKANLAPNGLSGVAALLAPGKRAVAIALDQPAPPLRKGDFVDVLATFDDKESVSGLVIADAVSVVDVGTESEAVTVAVSPSEATDIAFAIANAVVTVTVTGPPSQPPPDQRRATTANTATPATRR